MSSKKIIFLLYIYKIYLISAEWYRNPKVDAKIWVSMKDVGSGAGVKNISNLVLKEIDGVLERKNPTKEQIKKCKMTQKETFEKFDK